MPFETIASFVGKIILKQVIKDEIWIKRVVRKLFPPVKYQNRLRICIQETINHFEQLNTHPASPPNKFPFYHSQLLFESLSRFMLFNQGDISLLTTDFETNDKIIKPTAQELESFYQLFLEKVRADKLLKTIFLEENYQQRVFSNSAQLGKILHKVDAIKSDTEAILEKIKTPFQREASKELTSKLPLLLGDKIIKRADDLAEIRDKLVQNKQVVLVNGMGGIGKTTLAQMYLTEHYKDYKHLIWVGINSDDFVADFINTAGLKESLQVPVEGKTKKEIFDLLITRIKEIIHQENEQSLMILDNVEEEIVNYRDYLPHPPDWHILATSRHKVEYFNIIELDFLKEDQAVELFKLYYSRTNISDSEIRQIVRELEYHTLTIEILAKTAQNDGLDLQKTIRTLAENYSAEVITRHANRKIIKITSYLSTIFDKSKLSEAELWLLKMFYFLPPQFHSFPTISTILAPIIADTEINLQRILSNLVAKGWLLNNETTHEYRLHRIIGDVIKHSTDLPYSEISPLIESLSNLLSLDQAKDNPIDKFPWVIFGKNLLSKDSFNQEPLVGKLQNNLALVLQDLGEYGGAKELLEKAKKSAEKNFGKDHPDTAVRYSNLATVLKDLGDYEGAKELLEKAKISDEKNFGENHPNTAIRYSNLAMVLKALGNYGGAKELLEKAKKSAEKNFGGDHPTTAISYSNLATVLQALGDYGGAKELLEKVKILDEKNFGEDHPRTAVSYSNLGLVLKYLGDYGGAKELLEKAKISDEKNFGEDHPITAGSYLNLAMVLKDLGEYGGAKELLEKAKNLAEKNFGEDHPTTAISYSNLATVLQVLGEYAGAKELLERAKILAEKNLGEDHPTTAIRYSNLGLVLQYLGDFSAAKELFEKAVGILDEKLGGDHPTTLTAKKNLKLLLDEMKNGNS